MFLLARRTRLTVSFSDIGCSSAIADLPGEAYCTRICPHRLKIFWLMVYWNPFVKARVRSMAAMLIAVAVMASRMINREKDRSRLKATRRAINAATFKHYSLGQNYKILCYIVLQFFSHETSSPVFLRQHVHILRRGAGS